MNQSSVISPQTSAVTNQKFRRLEVWQKSMDLVELIYKLTESFPSSELYGLTSQLRRAVTSIVLNIAEGSGARSDKAFKNFLAIAMRSNYETMCALEIADRLNYCNEEQKLILLTICDEIAAMITGLKKKLNFS